MYNGKGGGDSLGGVTIVSHTGDNGWSLRGKKQNPNSAVGPLEGGKGEGEPLIVRGENRITPESKDFEKKK